jgi:hypothetical protein
MRRTIAVVALLGLMACSSKEDKATGSQAAPSPSTETLTVQVTAEQAGLGCVDSMQNSGLNVSTGGRITVTDGDGATVGTATFEISPGLEVGVDICDWTAIMALPTDRDFYVLDSGGEMLTLSQAELAERDWAVSAHIAINGDVILSPM